jgi:hypothetical protein
VVPAYEARDFGQTKQFIYTPASDRFARESTHDGRWVALDQDLLPLMREGLEHARARGFITGSSDLGDYHPTGIFIGWEVPGVFDVELQMRELSLKAVTLLEPTRLIDDPSHQGIHHRRPWGRLARWRQAGA